jgi:hypothetical protein
MMDYYGSIIKTEKEIDSELIQRFRDYCNESFIKKIISELRREQILHENYSVAGWMVFHSKPIYDIILIKINYELQKANKRIKLLYCYNQLFDELNICRMICDKI